MTGENLISINHLKREFSVRYVFAAVMMLALILIWPLSLLKITDPYINNRLLKQEGDYSYFYISSGEYLTTVIKGKGAIIDNAAIRLRFQEQVPEDASLNVYMFDSQGNVVIDEHISIYPRPENDIYEIPFNIELAKDGEYQFIVTPESEFTVGLYCYQNTSEPAVLLQNTDSSLLDEVKIVSILLNVCIWLCGLLFVVVLLLGDRIKAINRNIATYTAFVPSLVSVLGLVIYGQYLFDYNSDSLEGLKKSVILIIVLTLVGFLGTFVRKYELLLAGIILFVVGCIYLLTFPEGMIPDEKAHFYRAFSLAFGNFQAVKLSDLEVGGILPAAIREITDRNAVIDFNDTVAIGFKNTSLYSPICYLPQIIGIRVALLFTNHIHLVFMTARWFGFIGAFILCMLALYYMPFGKPFMFIVMLLPMTMQEMSGVTSDAMTNAFSFLFIAIVLKAVNDNQKLSNKQVMVITLLGTCIGMCKMVYVPLLLLVLLIPFRLMGSEDDLDASKNVKKARAKYALMLVIPLALCAITNSILGKNLVPVGENVDATAQIKYVITHIPETFMIVVRTIVNSTSQWLHEMTGDFLGCLNIRTLPAITLILLLMLYISARDMNISKTFSDTKAKLMFGLAFFTGYFMILGTLYVTWTTVGYYIIRGIQGRYFIALLPALGLFIAALYSGRASEENDNSSVLIDTKKNENKYNRLVMIVVPQVLLVINMIVIVDIYKYFLAN